MTMNEHAFASLVAEDARQDKLHELLETIREEIRNEIPPEHRPNGLFTNIQNAVYAMRGRVRLQDNAAITGAIGFAAGPIDPAPPAPRSLDEWSESDGDVVWWSLDENGEWRGEAAWIGTPLDLGRSYRLTIGDQEFVATLGGWAGYHTHWTPHPAFPIRKEAK